MRLCHLSDSHGTFPVLEGNYDAIVHTGDFFPNSHWIFCGDKVAEADFQFRWLQKNVELLKKQVGDNPYLFVLGNHDFMSPDLMERYLNSNGFNSFNLTNKLVNFSGVNFYGFPFIPVCGGNWNYEKDIPAMQVEVNKMVDQLNQVKVDVLACHAPMFQYLDRSYGNVYCGSTVIRQPLESKIKKEMLPRAYLNGHIHESAGVTTKDGMIVSNAGTTLHIIEI